VCEREREGGGVREMKKGQERKSWESVSSQVSFIFIAHLQLLKANQSALQVGHDKHIQCSNK